MDYNQTVHLPQTDFPMRAGLPKREPEMLQEMYDHDLYHKMVKRNEGKPTFVLHDGPPYANGNIHIGTALNKILKDMIVKHRNMTGWCAPYVPGWDTHGLPIESAVLKDKKVKRDEMTTAQFRTKCREYAESYIEKMTGQFQRLGVLGEWENPYITLLPEFEAKQIEVFGKMAEKGLIYKGMKPVYWCPFDQTALAEAEIEYADDPCTTIFVKFPVADDKGKLGQYADLSRTYFVIWTTTPWTIPGNYAICLNAEFDYVLLQVPSGDVYVLAQDLAESVCKAAGIDYAACTVLATLKGSAFELMRAKHPLFDRESVILNGEHVTLDAGSGCVCAGWEGAAGKALSGGSCRPFLWSTISTVTVIRPARCSSTSVRSSVPYSWNRMSSGESMEMETWPPSERKPIAIARSTSSSALSFPWPS